MKWVSTSRHRWHWIAPLVLSLQVLAACTGQGAGVTPTGQPINPVASGAASPVASHTAGPSLVPLSSSPSASATGSAIGTARMPVASPAGSSSATSGHQQSSTPQDAKGGDGEKDGGGGKNHVIVRNTRDANLEVRGNVQLNRIPGATATPENLAYAYSSCTDCQTFAVALQVNLISKTATVIAPQNVALAVNERCTRCYTVARAIQYNVQVDNPKEEPEDVRELLRERDKTLNEISHDKSITAVQAEQRINAVIAQFRTLSTSLYDRRDGDDRDDGKPMPSPAPTLSPTPSQPAPANPTATPIPSAVNTPTPGGVGATPVPSSTP